MNIIFIVVDTLRYDALGANGSKWIRTPNMDRLAKDAWVFDRHFAASFPTIPFRTDTMTGKYGGPFHPWKPLRYDVTTIPQALTEKGYRTQLIHDTPHLVNGGHNFDFPFHGWEFIRDAEVDRPWVSDQCELPKNWKRDPLFDFLDEVLDEKWVREQTNMATYARANRSRVKYEDWNAAKLFNTASQFVKDNGSEDKFFLWIDSFDPHEPWDVPPEYVKMYDDTPGFDGRFDPRIWHIGPYLKNGLSFSDIPPAALKRLRAFYAAKVTWMDHWLGKLLDTLDDTGLNEQTAVVLVGDHGTNLGEWSKVGKSAPVREWEGHTPLIIRLPEGESGRCDSFVQPQDLFATIMGLAGEEAPQDLDSHDILKLARGEQPSKRKVALSGVHGQLEDIGDDPIFTLFEKEWYLLFHPQLEKCKLHRYGSQRNFASDHPEIAARLRITALEEAERRGMDPKLIEWYHNGAKGKMPEGCRTTENEAPAGFKPYFQKTYRGWSKKLFD